MGGRNVSRQRGLGLALAAILLTGGCATAGGDQEEMRRLQARAAYERGLSTLRDKNAAQAVVALREAISLDPTVPVYWNNLGVIYLDMRRPDLALIGFRNAAELDDNYAEAHMNTGIALAEMGRWDEALNAYRKALASPTLPVPHIAYQNLGLALYHLKRYGEAEEALRFAIGLEPKLEAAFYNLGLVLVAQGRRDEAKRAFRQARDLAPRSPFGEAAVGQLKALGDGG
jgi:Tfp pilus assembly protein PilF